MKRFVDFTNALNDAPDAVEKTGIMAEYFRAARAGDAAWAVYFLLGRRLARAISGPELRELAVEASGLPEWLVDECIEEAGDLAEAAALIVKCGMRNAECGINREIPTLQMVIEQWVKPLREADAEGRRRRVLEAWAALDGPERLLFNKLIAGELRLGVARALLARALAEVAGIEPAEMAQRLDAPFAPTTNSYECLMGADRAPCGAGPPYPFQLAAPLVKTPDALGAREDWQAEWHYAGVRAQMLRRRGGLMIWSRHEELLTAQCPELGAPHCAIPDGAVLDGILAGWRGEGPLPPERLRQRLARKTLDKKTLAETPLVFVVFDLLELDGRDLRAAPLRERRRRLEEFFERLEAGGWRPEGNALRLAPKLEGAGWEELDELRGRARAAGARGLILKRLDAPYTAGRAAGDWIKWPAAPHRIEAVMIYAERGGTGLHTRLTLGAWEDGELAAVAQTEAEFEESWDMIEAFIKENTLEKHGPVRMVRPELVFEVAFEGVERAPRRRSGLILRGARVTAWRAGAKAERTVTLARLREMLG